MTKELPSPELLRKLLRYDPDTGKLFWRERAPNTFSDAKHSIVHICKKWNTRYAGLEAFFSVNGHGYKVGSINGKTFYAHRVAWAWFNQKWPDGQIDHIDGSRLNNSISNLRVADHKTNARNAKIRETNTSGHTGVYWRKDRNKWHARIKVDMKFIHIGLFETKKDAINARQLFEIRHGFTSRHGKPAQRAASEGYTR